MKHTGTRLSRDTALQRDLEIPNSALRQGKPFSKPAFSCLQVTVCSQRQQAHYRPGPRVPARPARAALPCQGPGPWQRSGTGARGTGTDRASSAAFGSTQRFHRGCSICHPVLQQSLTSLALRKPQQINI